jgi:hypothetical protein
MTVLLSLAATVGLSTAAIAASTQHVPFRVVYPTGTSPTDVNNVRAAVAKGGTVLLKARNRHGKPKAFNFGEYPVGEIDWDDSGSGYVALGINGNIKSVDLGDFSIYVSLGNNIRLKGEIDGNVRTTIRGGTIPIRNFGLRELPGKGQVFVYGLANLSIDGIRFSRSALQSIYTFQWGGRHEIRNLVGAAGQFPQIRIRNNEFINIQPASDTFSESWFALAAVTDNPLASVQISDNKVRFTPGRWDTELQEYEDANGLPPFVQIWEGFSIASLPGNATIEANDIRGIDVGLLVYFDGSGHVRIAGNRIQLRNDGLVAIQGAANHRYVIEKNIVIAPGTNTDGIMLWATDLEAGINHSVVRHNDVRMGESEFGAISFVGAGRNNLIAHNTVQGSAAYALGVVSDFDLSAIASNNLLVDNNISNFAPRESSTLGFAAHIFLDVNSRYNRVIGQCGTVLDLGVKNVLKCRHPAVKAATQEMRTKPEALRGLLRSPLTEPASKVLEAESYRP